MQGGIGGNAFRQTVLRPRGSLLFLVIAASALLPWLIGSPQWVVPGCSLVGLCLAISLSRSGWRAVMLLAPACLTLTAAQHRLEDRWNAERAGEVAVISGVVEDLPARRGEMQEFLFRVSPEERLRRKLPERIRVRWYNGEEEVSAGQAWRLPLRLQPPRGRVNFQGQDAERRYFARSIGALATVAPGAAIRIQDPSGLSLSSWRGVLRERLITVLADEPALAQVLALAIADRSLMSPLEWRVFSHTGTGHLLAISGLHIGFAGLLGYRLGWLLMWLSGTRARLRLGSFPGWISALSLASLYAALAGFAVSTQRALVMLLVLAFAVLSRRNPGPLLAWTMALSLVLLLNPAAPLEPGFWLSFGAVFVLISVLSPRMGFDGAVHARVLTQVAIVLAMLPLGMFWFQRATGLGLVANLFAIPAVSVVVVPLVLLGTGSLALGWEAVGRLLLLPAAWTANGLFRALSWFAEYAAGWQWTTGAIPFSAALVATVGCLFLLGPLGWRGRYLGSTLALGALSLAVTRPVPGELQLDLLDVGQGLALLVSTQETLLVYDSGPGQPGQWDLVEPVILPAIRATGHPAPTHIVIGHGDLDHAGGLGTLRQHFPATPAWVNSSRRPSETRPCDIGLGWDDATATYRSLHPSGYLPYLGNLSSCVLSIRTRDRALLLPGDIDRVVERRLVAEGLGTHDILIAPHHGSRTSSGPGFLAASEPGWVLIPAGAGNRFGFPHPEVLRRYRIMDISSASVSDCGAVRVRISPGGVVGIRSARRQRASLWRWEAAGSCP